MKTLLLALLLFSGGAAHAQTTPENLRVYLLTFGPGDAAWEKFGHNAIWVHDDVANFGVAYNWGMFSFDQPGFVPRLMQGRMLYWMAGYEVNAVVNSYVEQNRSVWAQELNLTPAQRDSMRAFLEWNARDENKFYLYDYFRDNCSTRVRDAIDRATGGALRPALTALVTNETYRTHTQKLTYMEPPLYAGLMVAMGPRIDQPITVWDEGFIPMELREGVRRVKVRGPDGSEQPLVLSERTIFEAAGREPLPERAPDMVLPFTIAGSVIAGVLLLLARLAWQRRKLAIGLAIILASWSLLVGLVGTLITLLWAFTDHVVTYNNENVLQANPVAFALVVLAPAAVLGKQWVRRWAAWFGLFVAGLSTLGFLLQAFPGLDQANGEIIGLMFPAHGAVAWILWQRWHVKLEELTEHVTHPSAR
ncbi:MAG: lipoprotein N-acyltransferase Lnb domain-containing protein [Gemmatimonadota bacterium]